MEPIEYLSKHSRGLLIPGGNQRSVEFFDGKFKATEQWQVDLIEKSDSYAHYKNVVRVEEEVEKPPFLPPPPEPAASPAPITYPKHRGGGWWELSDGSSVRGLPAAQIAERMLRTQE